MEYKNQFKYLVSSEQDLLWGLVVDNVGQAEVSNNYCNYPPSIGHPSDYEFNPKNRRILENYQLIYISQGRGEYLTAQDERISLTAGDMLIIPPYTMHSYCPDKKTGWREYWIGMRGNNIDAKFQNGFFSPNQLIYKVGLRDDIIQLYNQAIELAIMEYSTYQQTISGIGELILGLSRYYDRNQYFSNDLMVKNIDRARIIMRENYLKGISPQEVAERVNMGYSWFRKLFKEYTNVSPGHFMLELKLQKAKHTLLNTSSSVKEIAYLLGYEDATYFIAIFKKYTGFTPQAYREKFSSIAVSS